MKKNHKIRRAARPLAKNYIETLENGGEPMLLAAQVELGKYDILDRVNDARLNVTDTIQAVKREAHSMIKAELELRPALANRLVELRRNREAREREVEAQEDRKNNAKLGAYLRNMSEMEAGYYPASVRLK